MWDITLIFLVICSAWSQVCCILLQTLVNTSDKHSWKKQHVLYHTKETHYISFNNRIENKSHRNVNVATATALFSRIFTACSLEIFVPGALRLWQVSQHACAQTSFFPPLGKVNHGMGLWIWQKHKQPENGASGSASLGRIYSRENWTMKSLFFSQTSTKLHPPPHTHPLSSYAVLQNSIFLIQTSFLQVQISHHLNQGQGLQSVYTLTTSSQSGA